MERKWCCHTQSRCTYLLYAFVNKNGEVINCLFPVLELGVKTLLHTKLLISAFLTVDIVIFFQEIADLVCHSPAMRTAGFCCRAIVPVHCRISCIY